MSEHSDLVKSNFEKNYQSYDNFIHQVVPDYENLHQHVIAAFFDRVEKLSSIVDLGIGTGKTTKALCEIYKDVSVK
jgi:trans-aconitate methyltransferase